MAATSRSPDPPQASSASGAQQQHHALVGLGHHHRRPAGDRVTDLAGLVVPVEGGEGHREALTAIAPVGPLSEQTVGDVAERAVGPPQPGADEVGELAAEGALGVVHAHEAGDLRFGHHRSLARPDGP